MEPGLIQGTMMRGGARPALTGWCSLLFLDLGSIFFSLVVQAVLDFEHFIYLGIN